MEKLGIRTRTELHAMPNAEIVRWGAYYTIQAQRAELESLKTR
jgi:hypothetical protein